MKVIGPQVNWRRTKLYWVLASVAGYLCGYALYYLLLMLLATDSTSARLRTGFLL